MNLQQIITALDEEITLLTHVRALLTGTSSNGNRTRLKRGPMSAEGRKRIADAQRRRWAKVKKNR